MKKLVYLFAAMFAASIMLSCTGKTASSETVDSDSIEVVDSAIVDSVDTVAVDSICLD